MSESDDDLINSKWFVRWSLDSYGYEVYARHEDPAKYYPIAIHLSEEIAKHIVDQHNSWYALKSMGEAFVEALKNFSTSMEKLKKDVETTRLGRFH